MASRFVRFGAYERFSPSQALTRFEGALRTARGAGLNCALFLCAWTIVGSLACSRGDDFEVGVDCISIDDCETEQVCFFGKCVDPGYNIAQVHFDLTPPDNTGLLPQVDPESPRDLANGLEQNVALRESLTLIGTIGDPEGAARTGTLIAVPDLTSGVVPLPTLRLARQTTVGSSGFEMALVPGAYVLRFQPSTDSEIRPPLTLWKGPAEPGQGPLELIYPSDSALVTVEGVVLADGTVPSSIISGAVVEGSVETEAGLVDSTVGRTDSAGRYRIVFPAAADVFSVTVRSSLEPGGNPLVPTVTRTLSPLAENEASPVEVEPLSLDIPPGNFTLNGMLRAADDNAPIEGAQLLLAGEVGAGAFTISRNSDAAGMVSEIRLIPGFYTATVAPSTAQPYALTSTNVCIGLDPASEACTDVYTADSDLELIVQRKVEIKGRVTSHEGTAVINARVSLSRLHVPIDRSFTVTTDGQGDFSVLVDPGAQEPAQYEVIVEPQQPIGGSPLPRHRQLVSIDERSPQEIDVVLYDSSLIFGQVRGPDGIAIANVRVALYSTELASTPEDPLLVGLGESNADGEFVIPIPVPDSP